MQPELPVNAQRSQRPSRAACAKSSGRLQLSQADYDGEPQLIPIEQLAAVLAVATDPLPSGVGPLTFEHLRLDTSLHTEVA
jgi:hypothetical protein